MNDKLHMYSFAFTGMGRSVSLCKGLKSKNVKLKDIKEAKKESSLREESILIDCSYLGFMSLEEFVGAK